jgi:hypothetical protein
MSEKYSVAELLTLLWKVSLALCRILPVVIWESASHGKKAFLKSSDVVPLVSRTLYCALS